jgi:MoxR-like ATPase
MAQFYLRTESIKPDDILTISVINDYDKDILSALSSPEPCLLEGSRGTGKSFLMRVAEFRIEEANSKALTVYVSFNISSLIDTEDPLQFYH